MLLLLIPCNRIEFRCAYGTAGGGQLEAYLSSKVPEVPPILKHQGSIPEVPAAGFSNQ